MPTASRNERRKRWYQRNMSLLTRENKTLQGQALNTRFVLLALVQERGGTVVVPEEVAKATMQAFQHLDWHTKRKVDGAMVVTCTDRREAAKKAEEKAMAPGMEAITQSRPDRSVTAQLRDEHEELVIANVAEQSTE